MRHTSSDIFKQRIRGRKQGHHKESYLKYQLKPGCLSAQSLNSSLTGRARAGGFMHDWEKAPCRHGLSKRLYVSVNEAVKQPCKGEQGRSGYVSEPTWGPIPKERLVHWQRLFLLQSLLVSLFTRGCRQKPNLKSSLSSLLDLDIDGEVVINGSLWSWDAMDLAESS